MGKLIFFLITVLFISIATKLYKGQWSWFIPEYNMLPEDKKKEYNKNKLCRAYSYCMIICALATFLLLLNEFFPSNILFAISCGLFVISMFFDFLDAYKQWWEKVGIMLKSALMKILSIVSNILTR